MYVVRVHTFVYLLAAATALTGFLIPSNLPAWQKTIRFDRLTMEDGLPDEYVLSMAQDDFGYLWFGTQAGLAKYDGHKFTVFLPDPSDKTSLASSTVISVFVDREGTLWVGTDVGLDRFDHATESFTHFRHDPENVESMGGNVVKELFEDSRGQLWIGHWFGGLTRFDRFSGKFKRFVHDPDDRTSLPAGAIFEITEDNKGRIWVGTVNGEGTADAAVLESEEGTFRRIFTCESIDIECPKPASPPDRPENTRVVSILESQDGVMWFGGGDISRYDPESNTYQSYMHHLALDTVGVELLSDGTNGFWLAVVGQGLFHFDPESGEFLNYRHDPSDQSSIVSNRLNKLFRDRDGRIWITAYDSGVSSFHPGYKQLGHYRHQTDVPDSVIVPGYIKDVSESNDGSLWFVYDSLVNRISSDRKSARSYNPSESLENGECLGNFNTVTVDRTGTVWFGSDHGMCRYDSDADRLVRYPAPDPGLLSLDDDPNDYGVFGIHVDPDGYLWLDTQLGLWRVDPRTGERKNFLPDSEVNQQDWGSHISLYLAERNGRHWFGSTTGLILFDINSGDFKKFSHVPEDGSSISPGVVSSFVESHGYWVGTVTGVDRFDPETSSFTPILDSKGEALGMVDDIIVDRDGKLWVSTSRGIWRLDPRNEALWNFGFKDGLANPKMGEGHLLNSGEVVFVGGWGINLFDPAKVRPVNKLVDVVVTDFLLANRPVPISTSGGETPLKQSLDLAPRLELSWRDYIFSFEFAALEFAKPERISYSYKLDGFDKDWIETDHEHRVATFTNIPPGRYDFRVRARYQNGAWSQIENTVSLTVLPPPWRSWWAYLLYSIALLVTVFLAIHIRTSTLRRRAADLQLAVDDRTRELRENEAQVRSLAKDLEHQLERNEALIANISHEFRTPLTLILGPANRLLEKVEKPEIHALLRMIRRNSRRLLRLVDQLLGLSRLKADETLPREAQNVNATVDAICSSFNPVATERQLTIDSEVEPGLWVMCAPDTLDNIVLNLVSNAVKNTPPDGRVTVRGAADSRDWVEIIVSDTGVGISPEDQQAVFERFRKAGGENEKQPGSGIGLALVKELVFEHGGQVHLDSVPGKGTSVRLTLPRTDTPDVMPEKGTSTSVGDRLELEAEIVRQPEINTPLTHQHKETGLPLVLVVEDNADMRSYIVGLLSKYYDCIESDNGKDAVDLAKKHVPDIVLCDIMLPGMDGFQISHVIKEDVRTCHVPIILLTARHDRDSRLEGWKEKVDGYLTKPFSDEELLMRISNLLEIREILRSRFTDQFFSENSRNGMSPKDRDFLTRIETELEQHHAEGDYGLEQMASALYVSSRQLQRKLKAISGQSPVSLLRAFRLRKARKLLALGVPVSQVADSVGFSSAAYFSSCFKAQFAMTPREFQVRFTTQQD